MSRWVGGRGVERSHNHSLCSLHLSLPLSLYPSTYICVLYIDIHLRTPAPSPLALHLSSAPLFGLCECVPLHSHTYTHTYTRPATAVGGAFACLARIYLFCFILPACLQNKADSQKRKMTPNATCGKESKRTSRIKEKALMKTVAWGPQSPSPLATPNSNSCHSHPPSLLQCVYLIVPFLYIHIKHKGPSHTSNRKPRHTLTHRCVAACSSPPPHTHTLPFPSYNQSNPTNTHVRIHTHRARKREENKKNERLKNIKTQWAAIF